MRKTFYLIVALLAINFSTEAQSLSGWTTGFDSVTIHFDSVSVYSDTISMPSGSVYGGMTNFYLDTLSMGIWQVGKTTKPVFSTSPTVYSSGIMIDTTGYYPTNANSSFSVHFTNEPANMIVKIWHKYETTPGVDGGLVEFSTDSGATWQNVVGCPAPSFGPFGVYLDSFYTLSDSLTQGNIGFSGNSGAEILSQFQFLDCSVEVSTPCGVVGTGDPLVSLYLRFRFVSDSIPDTLSGWMIDSIRVINPGCVPDAVNEIRHSQTSTFSPNPASNELTISTTFTTLYTITLVNMLGQQVYKAAATTAQQIIEVSRLPAGVYEVEIENGNGERYYEKAVIIH